MAELFNKNFQRHTSDNNLDDQDKQVLREQESSEYAKRFLEFEQQQSRFSTRLSVSHKLKDKIAVNASMRINQSMM
jgi:hypothetical protein